MSWEERLRIAHQVLEERAKQLKDMGISVQGGGISVDASKRYLLNLAPDLDELTMCVDSDCCIPSLEFHCLSMQCVPIYSCVLWRSVWGSDTVVLFP